MKPLTTPTWHRYDAAIWRPNHKFETRPIWRRSDRSDSAAGCRGASAIALFHIGDLRQLRRPLLNHKRFQQFVTFPDGP